MGEGGEKKKGFRASVSRLGARVKQSRDEFRMRQAVGSQAREQRDEQQYERNKAELKQLNARERRLELEARIQRKRKRISNLQKGPGMLGPMSPFNGLLGGMNEIGNMASKMGPQGIDTLGDMGRAADAMDPFTGQPRRKKAKKPKKGRDITIHIKR